MRRLYRDGQRPSRAVMSDVGIDHVVTVDPHTAQIEGFFYAPLYGPLQALCGESDESRPRRKLRFRSERPADKGRNRMNALGLPVAGAAVRPEKASTIDCKTAYGRDLTSPNE
jgi:hypothetical protein